MEETSEDPSSFTRLGDAAIAIGIALGGGGLLLAAIVHLAAPVIAIAPVVAIDTPHIVAPRDVPRFSTRPLVVRAVPQPTTSHMTSRAAQGRAARSAARVGIANIPAPMQAPLGVRHAFPISRQPVVVGAIVPPQARPIVVAPAHGFVQRRVDRVFGRANVAPTRRAVGASIARTQRGRVAKAASRSKATALATPEPPVGFNDRPTLVEAPNVGSPTTTAALANDGGLAGLRLRGRLLAVPAPLATPAPLASTNASR